MSTDTALDLDLTVTGVGEAEELQDVWRCHFHTWLANLHPQLPRHLRAPAYALGLSLCDDAAISALNSAWRGQEGPTDVLAFALQDEPIPRPPTPLLMGRDDQEPLELGDIVISLETARRQAVAEGHSLSRELLFLASHGLLHLVGWDHPDEAALTAMLARQEELLAATVHLPLVAQEPCDREPTG